jgi:hypothetical protein
MPRRHSKCRVLRIETDVSVWSDEPRLMLFLPASFANPLGLSLRRARRYNRVVATLPAAGCRGAASRDRRLTPERGGTTRADREETGARHRFAGNRRRDLCHLGDAAGCPRFARRQAVLRRRHARRRRACGGRPLVPPNRLHVASRGSNKLAGLPHGKGSVSVIDFATQKVMQNWPVPDGGSPDMGNVSAVP